MPVKNVNASGNSAGISIDQAAANALGSFTRVPSLVLGTGYSGDGADLMSWKDPTTPIGKTTAAAMSLVRSASTSSGGHVLVRPQSEDSGLGSCTARRHS